VLTEEASAMTLFEAACLEARAVSTRSLAVPMSKAEWEATVDERREMWREMLGLSPLPDRAPLQATVTGTLDRDDYVVEKIHFQSLAGAYVPGNIYRPAEITERLPAVVYLCGHTKGKVNPPYQANPRWFGQHGYVAFVLDPIQLGESQGLHHGTYREGRWDWYSRGYTPAGTEVWNAMRAIDYLQTRDDVDPERIGVTGLSGGGAMSWFLGAADDRVKCVAPVCQTGSIEHIICDRATDGHCDCAFWINYYQWCTPDIGALIAPRALLVAAGTEDVLWRPYAFRDALHRIHHQYDALGIPDNVKLVEDLTPHGYTPKLRKAIFEWFNRHLKGDESPVTDDVTEFVEPEENLLVFGGQLPEDDAMKRVDTLLVKRAEPPPLPGDEPAWKTHQEATLAKLRSVTFRQVPEDCSPELREHRADGSSGSLTYGTYVFDAEDGLTLRLRTAMNPEAERPLPTVVFALPEDVASGFAGAGRARPGVGSGIATAGVEVRNTAATSVGPGYLWTLRRAYPVLGHTLPERQVYDLLAGAALMRDRRVTGPIAAYGSGNTAVLAIYAALLDPEISEVILADPPESHENPETPDFLGILRFGDLPQNLALLYPRPITFVGKMPAAYEWTKGVYERLGRGEAVREIGKVGDWRPA
jgi:dienelactone hydrolase